MSFATYDELKASVADYLHRDDLTAVIPDFITLGEERMNRVLRVRQMEVALAATAIADGYISLPAAMVGVRSLWIVGNDSTQLYSQTYDYIISHDTGGDATHWALAGDRIYFNGTGTVEGLVYTAIPALSDSAPTNWLLTAHPSAYLRAAMLEAAIYIRDPEGIAFCQSTFDAILMDIMGSNSRDVYSGPLQVRVR